MMPGNHGPWDNQAARPPDDQQWHGAVGGQDNALAQDGWRQTTQEVPVVRLEDDDGNE